MEVNLHEDQQNVEQTPFLEHFQVLRGIFKVSLSNGGHIFMITMGVQVKCECAHL